MSHSTNGSGDLIFAKAKKTALYSLIANAPKGVNFHSMREVFGLDSDSAKRRLKSTLGNLKENGHIRYDSAHQRYFATRPTSPLMVARAQITDNGIELEPVRWSGSKATRPFMLVKKGDTEYDNIRDGDKLLVAIQSTHMQVVDGNRKKPVSVCAVLQRLSPGIAPQLRASFAKNAQGAVTLSAPLQNGKGLSAQPRSLGFEGPYAPDDYQQGAKVLFRIDETTSQHTLSGAIIDLAEWKDEYPARLLSARDKANAMFTDDIYTPAQEQKAARIALIAPRPATFEDKRDTIQFAVDPEDAKDRDDAISARPDPDPANKGGHIITISNIDVTRLVTQMPEVLENASRHPLSAYTNDAAIHMLPKAWAENAASLTEGQDRFCMSIEIRIDAQGQALESHVYRSLNRPHIVSYNTFDHVLTEGKADGFTPEMVEAAQNIMNAYEALTLEDSNRQALNFKQARYYIEKDEQDRIKGVKSEAEAGAISRDIIKKFMGFSNLITREECERLNANTIDRVESAPNIHLRLPKNIAASNKEAQFLNRIWTREEIQSELDKHANDPAMEQAISDLLIQRVMRPGRFTTTEVGHFGMGLTDRPYASFSTSVRSLDSLVNQMSLFEAKGWLDDYCNAETKEWLHQNFLSPQAQTGIAEFMNDQQPVYKRLQREAMRRQAIAHLHQYEGKTVSARFQHVTDQEMSLKLEDCARPFLLPLSAISGATFMSDVARQQLIDRDHGRVIMAEEWMELKLQLADPLTNRLIVSIPERQPKIETTAPRQRDPDDQSIICRATVIEATTKALRIRIGDTEINLSQKIQGSRSQRREGLYHYNTGITLKEGEKQNFQLVLHSNGQIAQALPTNQKRLETGKTCEAFYKAHGITIERTENKRIQQRQWQGLDALAAHPLFAGQTPEIAAE